MINSFPKLKKAIEKDQQLEVYRGKFVGWIKTDIKDYVFLIR